MRLLQSADTIYHEPRSKLRTCRSEFRPNLFRANGRFYQTKGTQHRRAVLTQIRLLLVRRTRPPASQTVWRGERHLSYVGPKYFFGSNRTRRSIRFHSLPDKRSLEYSGKRVRFALIVVDLVNRRPIEILRDEYGFLDFNNEGRLKVSELGKEKSLAFDMLAPLLSDQTNSQVIDARNKFAKKRYFDKFS
jgi:hypothetical protein